MELGTLTGRPGSNVKGPSPLARLLQFDLVWGFSVDYKHCMLFGVTRQFTEYLFNSTNCREDFYFGNCCMHCYKIKKKNVPLPFLE